MAATRRNDLGHIYRDVKHYSRMNPFKDASPYEVVWVDEEGRWYGKLPPDREKDKFLKGGVVRWWVYRGPASTEARTGEYPRLNERVTLTLFWHADNDSVRNPIRLQARVFMFENAAAQQQHFRMTVVYLAIGDYVGGDSQDIKELAQGRWTKR